jgi:hypothetical protein
MSTTKGLTDLLFGRTRGAVLALLYGRADQSFYTREIAREVDACAGAVQRELENLSKVGLILRKSVGNQVFYQASLTSTVFCRFRPIPRRKLFAFHKELANSKNSDEYVSTVYLHLASIVMYVVSCVHSQDE